MATAGSAAVVLAPLYVPDDLRLPPSQPTLPAAAWPEIENSWPGAPSLLPLICACCPGSLIWLLTFL